jgi:RHS repeat-associated protein
VTRIVDPLGHATVVAYSPVGDGRKPSARTDPLGRVTTFEYDALARLVKTTHADGTIDRVSYDAEGRVTSTIDRMGATTTFLRDAVGREVLTTFPDGATLASAYDEVGRSASLIDERGNSTVYAYAPNRRTVTNALGQATIHDYNGSGRLARVTDPLGRILLHTYDSVGNPLSATFPDGTTTSTTYDAARQAIARTDQAGRTTHHAYDAAGRLVSVTDPAGNITTYGYDAAGRRITERDANGRTTQIVYDAAGRERARTRPGGEQETLVRDAIGNVVAKTDYNGRTVTFVHDAMSRVVRKVLPGGVEIGYAYDAAGRRTASGGDTFQYDSRGRLVREAKAGGQVLDYLRDATGHVASLTTPHGTTSYTHDALGRIATVTTAAGTTVHAYDAAGNLASVAHPNGVVATHVYDTQNRLLSIAHSGPGGLLSAYAYTLGPSGHRLRVVESGPATAGRTVHYAYDAADRLTQERIEEPGLPDAAVDYIYDAAGNRLRMTRGGVATDYVYDSNDRLVSQVSGGAAVNYGWDANGNLASRTAGAAVDTYFHDAEDRLTGVVGASGAIGYAYDADGMRVSRSAGGITTSYLVDKALPASTCPCGPDLPGAMGQVVAETTGVATVTYAYGHSLIERAQPGIGTHTYLRDAQRSVRQLATAAGVVSDRYNYDAFGVALASTGATPNAYRYAGEQLDPDAGLYYLRARHYDPALGRFASTDPQAGRIDAPATLHRYLYAGGDPVGQSDPTGRDFTLPSLTIAQAVQVSLNVGFVATLGARATGYAKDWSEAANIGMIATVGTLALLVPYSLAFGGELAAARGAASLATRSDAFRVALHTLRIAAVEGPTSILGKEALFEVEKHMAIFVQQSFRNPTVRCTVIAGLGGTVVGALGLLGGNIPGAPNYMASAKVINYEPLAAAMESLMPGLRHTFGCP